MTKAARPDAALVERERIAQAIEREADLRPCEQDARVLRSTATLIRANFSHDDAEALDTLNHRAATALHVAAIPMPAGHYSIGSRHWPGLAKMCGIAPVWWTALSFRARCPDAQNPCPLLS